MKASLFMVVILWAKQKDRNAKAVLLFCNKNRPRKEVQERERKPRKGNINKRILCDATTKIYHIKKGLAISPFNKANFNSIFTTMPLGKALQRYISPVAPARLINTSLNHFTTIIT